MKITHGFVYELYEKAKEHDSSIWFKGLELLVGQKTLHIVVQKYSTQKVIRTLEKIHVHIHFSTDGKKEGVLLYHDGGKTGDEIKIVNEYPELLEAIRNFAHKNGFFK